MRRINPLLVALAVALFAGVAIHPLARAGDPVPVAVPVPVPVPAPDPSPLTGAAPKDAAVDAAVHRFDAAQQGAAAQAFANQAAGVASPAEGEPTGSSMPAGGRTGHRIEPSVSEALQQLKRIELRTAAVALEPTPEIAHTIAQEAWGYMIEQSNQVVITQRRPEPDYFSGRFKPMSVDDLPPVLRVRVSKSEVVVPSPVAPATPPAAPPPAPPASSWIPRDFLAKGVLMGFDEAAIRDAMAGGAVASVAEADAAEAALLAAGADEAAAAKALRTLPAGPAVPGRDAAVRSVSLRRAIEAPAGAPRPFGGITRVVGIVLQADGDVRVLGREEAGAPPLLLDDVVTALATVWRDGLTPGCSLDPDPLDTGGPQHVRVIGVPADSAFAKTMLDADYEMKKILCGIVDVGVEGVRAVPDLMLENPEPGADQRNRFWLCAVPPRPGDLAISGDRRTILLSCAVEARTERMLLGERGERGTGTTTAAAEVAAKAFSAHYEGVARARPVFRRLEGLFDLVLLARALRVVAPDHPLLARASSVAREPVSVPSSYPGVSTTRTNSNGWVTVSGGCEIGVPFERRVLRRLSDGDAQGLAAAAAADGVTSVRLPGSGHGLSEADRDDDVVDATMALVRGDVDDAIARTDAVLDRDPAHARARALRAEAFRAAGRPGAAMRDALAAAALEPDDVAYEVLVRRLRMDEEGAEALQGAPPHVTAEVVRVEVTAAASALSASDGAAALKAVSRALLGDPLSFEASAIGASAAWMTGALDEADAHVARALKSRPGAPEPRVLRAVVLLSRRRGPEALADLDAAIAVHPEADYLALRAFARLLVGDVPGAADDTGRAAALAPRSDLATGAAAAVMMAAYAPLATVQGYVADLFALPPRAMMALGSAYAAAQQGRAADAAAGYQQALAVLDAAQRPPDAARTRIEIALLGLVPASGLFAPEEVRARVEALTAALEARGDAPVSTHFARAIAENGMGEREAALARIEAACEALERPDVCLAELFPGRGPSVEALLRTVQVAVVMAQPEELLHGPRLLELLGRFPKLLEGGPGVPAAKGLLEFVTALRADPQGNRPAPEFRASMARRVEEVRKGFESGRATLADAVVAAIFVSMVSQIEAAMGDVPAAETAAKVLWGLPTPDDMSPYGRLLIPTLRAKTAGALLERWMREADGDAEFVLEDPADPAAVKRLRGALEVRRKRAEALGEPAFALLFEARTSGLVSDVLVKSDDGRARRIERLIKVAAPGPKRDRLVADLAAIRREADAAKSSHGTAIRERVATAYAAAKSLTQMHTLDKALAKIASKAGPDAPHWVAPPDAGLEALKRTLERARERTKETK